MAANIISIFSVLILGVAIWFGVKNKEAYEAEMDKRYKMETTLDQTRGSLIDTKKTLATTEGELNETNGINESLAKNLSTQEEKNLNLEESIESKKEIAAEKKGEVELANESLKDLGDVEELIARMKRTQRELAELSASLSDKEAKIATLSEQKANTQTSIDGLAEVMRLRRNKISSPGLATSIRSVYRGWGFVTIASGDYAGIVKGSTLDVMRDGQKVAQLLVTAVESNSAAADIIPSSIEEGETVYPGDKVVATSVTPASAPASASN